MSCSWDIGCKTCNVRSGIFDVNHGDGELTRLIEQAPAIAAAAEIEWPYFIDGDGRQKALAVFFKQHEGHVMLPKDEYGKWATQCWKSVACPTCKCLRPCVLNEDHKEPCSAEKAQ
jgi:hypothetical protein